MNNTYQNYVQDCLVELIERSKEAKQEADKTNNKFDQGKSFGYYEVLTYLLNQAEIFGIKSELKKVIKDFEPSF